MTKKVLVSDKLSASGLKVLEEGGGLEVDVRTGMPEDELIKAIEPYEGIIIRSGTQLTEKVLENASNLKVIGRAGVGVDNIDVAAATRLGIVVMNTPDGNTISTCEHTMAMLMALARKIPDAVADLRSGGWNRSKFQGVEVYGKTIGVVGFGRIGQQVALRCKAFGMKIVAMDPFLDPKLAKEKEIELVDLERLLKVSDFITIHSPLSDETRNLIDTKEIGLMKKGVRIINCARGGIVNEDAILAGLESGQIAGVALDAFAKEPPTGHPLLKREDVIATPHLGAATVEAQENVAVVVANQIRDFLLEGTVRNALNVQLKPGLDSPLWEAHLHMMEAMGTFLAQLADGFIKKVRVEYHGEAAEMETAHLTSWLMKGLLSRSVKGRVNYINAQFVAKERGLEVVQSTSSESKDFRGSVFVKVGSGGSARSLTGTVLDDLRLRVTRIDGYDTDVILEGIMLVFSHIDQPGILGQLGSMLGKFNVNIASMHLGREAPGGKAVTIMNVDSPPSVEALKALQAMEEIGSLKVVTLEMNPPNSKKG